MFLIHVLTIITPVCVISTAAHSKLTRDYEGARNTRLIYGHDAAVPLYQKLLLQNPHDQTAATRIAASKSTPLLQDRACPTSAPSQDVNHMKYVLQNYDNVHVQRLFGVQRGRPGFESQGPLFIRPVTSGSTSSPPILYPSDGASLEETTLVCLVSLFLLGFAVPRHVLEEKMIGGKETIEVMEKLGLAFPFDQDSSSISPSSGTEWIVPYVHIFPMDVHVVVPKSSAKKTKSIRLVTDLHPTILGQTTVGTKGDGAVMYIGPDSLALVQHLPLESHVDLLQKNLLQQPGLQILDLCTGSGVQAIATLVALEETFPQSTVVCVDINDRALRFVHFNAMLNALDPDRFDLLNIDLREYPNACQYPQPLFSSQYHHTFDIILSNPPFIPVPWNEDDNGVGSVIQRKYGLFSSGGVTGEILLKKVLELSSTLLREDGGLLAIVSEFMNPPIESEERGERQDWEIIQRLKQWWGSHSARGVFFTNQIPLSSDEYARRRSSGDDEYKVWRDNLRMVGITRISPGLLFLMTQQRSKVEVASVSIENAIVPKTELGSIWTPHNKFAVSFTKESWAKLYTEVN